MITQLLALTVCLTPRRSSCSDAWWDDGF